MLRTLRVLAVLVVFAALMGVTVTTHQQLPPSAGGSVALTGARVIDGTGAAPIDGTTIVITNGRIEAVGKDAAVRIPAGATRIDLTCKTVMPGMINAHGHLEYGDQKLSVR